MSAATPGQAPGDPSSLFARWYRLKVEVSDASIERLWRMATPADHEFWRSLDAAQEPRAAEVEAAFAGGMRVRTAPCPVESHDGEHLQYRTGEHWLCAIMLAGMLVAADVIADPALELAAAKPGELGTAWRLLNQLREQLAPLATDMHAEADASGDDRVAAALHEYAARIRQLLPS